MLSHLLSIRRESLSCARLDATYFLNMESLFMRLTNAVNAIDNVLMSLIRGLNRITMSAPSVFAMFMPHLSPHHHHGLLLFRVGIEPIVNRMLWYQPLRNRNTFYVSWMSLDAFQLLLNTNLFHPSARVFLQCHWLRHCTPQTDLPVMS